MMWPTGDEWWIKFAIGLLSFLAVAGNVFLAWRKQRKIDNALIASTHDQVGMTMREGGATALFFDTRRADEIVRLMDRLTYGLDRNDTQQRRILDALDKLADKIDEEPPPPLKPKARS